MLTAKQIVEKGIIFLSEENKRKYNIELKPAQAGIDLHMISCFRLTNKPEDIGYIYNDNATNKKTVISKTEVYKTNINTDGIEFWYLELGMYEIGFAEGCNFDSKSAGKIVHRSSLYRNGCEINSPLWDPGFHTDEMGTFLIVHNPIRIEKGARVGQMLVFETNEEAELYGSIAGKSQYQGTGVLNGNH